MEEAAKLLGRYKDVPFVFDVLMLASVSGEPNVLYDEIVREAAVKALGGLKLSPSEQSRYYKFYDKVLSLEGIMRHKGARFNVIWVRGELNDPQARVFLREALKHEDYYIRGLAADVIVNRKFDDPLTVQALNKAASEVDTYSDTTFGLMEKSSSRYASFAVKKALESFKKNIPAKKKFGIFIPWLASQLPQEHPAVAEDFERNGICGAVKIIQAAEKDLIELTRVEGVTLLADKKLSLSEDAKGALNEALKSRVRSEPVTIKVIGVDKIPANYPYAIQIPIPEQAVIFVYKGINGSTVQMMTGLSHDFSHILNRRFDAAFETEQNRRDVAYTLELLNRQNLSLSIYVHDFKEAGFNCRSDYVRELQQADLKGLKCAGKEPVGELLSVIQEDGWHLAKRILEKLKCGGGYLLSREEEVELFRTLETGIDSSKRKDIVGCLGWCNLGLVIEKAKKYLHRGIEFKELVSEGYLGLLRGIEEFDYKRGYRFSTFAGRCICWSIIWALANKFHTIQVPIYIQDKQPKLRLISEKFTQEFCREPTQEELTEITDFSEEAIKNLIITCDPISLDSPFGAGEDSLLDLIEQNKFVSPRVNANRYILKENIRKLLSQPNDNQRIILVLRYGLYSTFGETKTRKEIGNLLCLSEERIRQVEEAAIRKSKGIFKASIKENKPIVEIPENLLADRDAVLIKIVDILDQKANSVAFDRLARALRLVLADEGFTEGVARHIKDIALSRGPESAFSRALQEAGPNRLADHRGRALIPFIISFSVLTLFICAFVSCNNLFTVMPFLLIFSAFSIVSVSNGIFGNRRETTPRKEPVRVPRRIPLPKPAPYPVKPAHEPDLVPAKVSTRLIRSLALTAAFALIAQNVFAYELSFYEIMEYIPVWIFGGIVLLLIVTVIVLSVINGIRGFFSFPTRPECEEIRVSGITVGYRFANVDSIKSYIYVLSSAREYEYNKESIEGQIVGLLNELYLLPDDVIRHYFSQTKLSQLAAEFFPPAIERYRYEEESPFSKFWLVLRQFGPEVRMCLLGRDFYDAVRVGAKLYPGELSTPSIRFLNIFRSLYPDIIKFSKSDTGKKIFSPTSDVDELAKKVKEYLVKPGELQVSVDFNLGEDMFRERPGFIALALFIATADIDRFCTLEEAPHRDTGAARGIVIRGIRVVEPNGVNQFDGHRLDYIFRVSENTQEKNLKEIISYVQYLNLGALLASGARGYSRRTNKEHPSLVPIYKVIVEIYEEFERKLIRILREIDREKKSGSVYCIPGQEKENNSMRESLVEYRLDEALYPDRRWLADLSEEEDTIWPALLPYLRGIEGIMLHRQAEEGSEPLGDKLIGEVRQLVAETSWQIRDIVERRTWDVKYDRYLNGAPLEREKDPFLDTEAEYFAYTTAYANAVVAAIREKRLTLLQAPNPAGIAWFASGGKTEKIEELLENNSSFACGLGIYAADGAMDAEAVKETEKNIFKALRESRNFSYQDLPSEKRSELVLTPQILNWLNQENIQLVLPASGISSRSPPGFLWYKSKDRFLLACAYDSVIYIPFELIVKLIQAGQEGLLIKLFEHEKKHLLGGREDAQEGEELARELFSVIKEDGWHLAKRILEKLKCGGGYLLSREEEIEFFKALGNGISSSERKDILDCLLRCNLGLVGDIAGEYLSFGMEFRELFNEGYFGLLRTIEKFDYRRGFRFSTYADSWIRQSITRALADKSHMIRAPVYMLEKKSKLENISREFVQEYRREPTLEELARRMSLPVEKIKKLLEIRDPVSLDAPASPEGEDSQGSFIEQNTFASPRESTRRAILKEAVGIMLGKLEDDERMVLILRYGLFSFDDGRMALEKIGDLLCLTKERVRQIEEKSLKRLRLIAGQQKYQKPTANRAGNTITKKEDVFKAILDILSEKSKKECISRLTTALLVIFSDADFSREVAQYVEESVLKRGYESRFGRAVLGAVRRKISDDRKFIGFFRSMFVIRSNKTTSKFFLLNKSIPNPPSYQKAVDEYMHNNKDNEALDLRCQAEKIWDIYRRNNFTEFFHAKNPIYPWIVWMKLFSQLAISSYLTRKAVERLIFSLYLNKEYFLKLGRKGKARFLAKEAEELAKRYGLDYACGNGERDKLEFAALPPMLYGKVARYHTPGLAIEGWISGARDQMLYRVAKTFNIRLTEGRRFLYKIILVKYNNWESAQKDADLIAKEKKLWELLRSNRLDKKGKDAVAYISVWLDIQGLTLIKDLQTKRALWALKDYVEKEKGNIQSMSYEYRTRALMIKADKLSEEYGLGYGNNGALGERDKLEFAALAPMGPGIFPKYPTLGIVRRELEKALMHDQGQIKRKHPLLLMRANAFGIKLSKRITESPHARFTNVVNEYKAWEKSHLDAGVIAQIKELSAVFYFYKLNKVKGGIVAQWIIWVKLVDNTIINDAVTHKAVRGLVISLYQKRHFFKQLRRGKRAALLIAEVNRLSQRYSLNYNNGNGEKDKLEIAAFVPFGQGIVYKYPTPGFALEAVLNTRENKSQFLRKTAKFFGIELDSRESSLFQSLLIEYKLWENDNPNIRFLEKEKKVWSLILHNRLKMHKTDLAIFFMACLDFYSLAIIKDKKIKKALEALKDCIMENADTFHSMAYEKKIAFLVEKTGKISQEYGLEYKNGQGNRDKLEFAAFMPIGKATLPKYATPGLARMAIERYKGGGIKRGAPALYRAAKLFAINLSRQNGHAITARDCYEAEFDYYDYRGISLRFNEFGNALFRIAAVKYLIDYSGKLKAPPQGKAELAKLIQGLTEDEHAAVLDYPVATNKTWNKARKKEIEQLLSKLEFSPEETKRIVAQISFHEKFPSDPEAIAAQARIFERPYLIAWEYAKLAFRNFALRLKPLVCIVTLVFGYLFCPLKWIVKKIGKPCLVLFTFLILTAIMQISPIPQPKVYINKSKDSHHQLMVERKPYIVKGVCYSPIPIGQNYDYDWWSDPNNPWITDGKLMQEMGSNTIRIYTVGQNPQAVKQVIGDFFKLYGVRTILGHDLGLWDGPCTAYNDKNFREKIKNEVLEMVNRHKDEPGVLMWILGNENNRSFLGQFRPWCTSAIDQEPNPSKQIEMRARVYYSFVNELAKEIHKIDPNHPVALGNCEITNLSLAAAVTKDVDLIACMIYRGKTFGNLFKSVKADLDKPILVAEFGADAYDAYLNKEDQNMQAYFLEMQWRQIYENLAGSKEGMGNCLGGIMFEWTDEWWKHNESAQECNNSNGWKTHNTESNWSNGSYYHDIRAKYNKNMNEEWFGIVAVSEEKESGLNKRIPRKSYYIVKQLWKSLVEGKNNKVKVEKK
ncbi:MAG: sigma-70 family RNA polymerase sigma factor [Candidatus Omnitrophica bacterium]|nr:sigma-70 family RNA polymerase sigma factor [Candidatus Omnitrophota bacterium]